MNIHLKNHSLLLTTWLFLAAYSHADWRTDIGHDRLVQLTGSTLPAIPSEGLSQIEALTSADNYIPNIAASEFSTHTFNVLSGTSSTSGHANTVARNYFSTTNGIFTTATTVDLYSASPWINSGFLNTGTTLEPVVETRAVQNHSWIGNFDSDTTHQDAIRRLDYAINRDGFSCVVGVNNGSNSTLPDLLAHSYHSISVGLTNGNHSSGTTVLDSSGRTKPEIVAPSTATSFATPMVSSSAALLHSALGAAPHSLSGADRTRAIKALLMASARKDTVQRNWSNSPSSPLDADSGAGELNIFLAYKILSAGAVSSSTTTSYSTHGWATESVDSGSDMVYFFTIPEGSVSPPVSAVITWHRVVEDGLRGPSWGSPTSSFADLNLKLHQADGTTLGTEINSSISSVDNVELIHEQALPPGDYAWVVESSSSTSTPYALAWQTIPTLSVEAADNTASEIDTSTGEVTITRHDDTTLPLLVNLSFGGSAIDGIDFVSIPDTVIIPAGQDSVTITVTPVSDDEAQGNRTLTIQAVADFTYTADATQSAEIIIEDKPFDQWLAANFDFNDLADATISGEDADPDFDNIPNLIEYALATDPKEFTPFTLFNMEANGRITLTATKNPDATDITWSAEDSNDLENWTPSNIITNTTTDFQAEDVNPTPGEGRRFIRLRITRQ